MFLTGFTGWMGSAACASGTKTAPMLVLLVHLCAAVGVLPTLLLSKIAGLFFIREKSVSSVAPVVS
jgi:hypothetical protein